MSDQAAVDTVTTYLRLVEERRLEEASAYLAADAEIVFPGGRSFADLDEQVAAAQTRYRNISKVFDGFDVMPLADSIVVYVYGTLQGEGPTGNRFAGILFIDRFELADGLVISHRVWNDFAALASADE